MHGLAIEEQEIPIATTAVVRDARQRAGEGCRPLWLTPREAESLLVLCVASPVSAGPVEQDLFVKLGDFFRAYLL